MKSGSTARHVDGMSSDDEMTELEATAFRNQRGKVRGYDVGCYLRCIGCCPLHQAVSDDKNISLRKDNI
jgi:hypothetical protein